MSTQIIEINTDKSSISNSTLNMYLLQNIE